MQQTPQQIRSAGGSAGMTLVELIIVVAIIAMIAAFAIPNYQNSVIKSKRAIAQGELMEVLSRQEQAFVNNKAYATTLTGLGYPANPYYIDDQGNALSAVAGSIYEISFAAGSTATAFTLLATPKNAQASDSECGTLQLSNTGLKGVDTTTATGTATDCW